MFIFIRAKRIAIIAPLFIAIVFVLIFAPDNRDGYSLIWDVSVPANSDLSEEFAQHLEKIILTRDNAMLENDIEAIRPLYNANTRLGIYAFEHEQKKVKYLHSWAEKQGVKFLDINTFLRSDG